MIFKIFTRPILHEFASIWEYVQMQVELLNIVQIINLSDIQ